MLISIIVPVYNVEPYIRACLDSLADQTYQDVEIILIDDGSTDNSGVVCREYIKKYYNFRYYHTQNQGLSAARNYGIEKAAGEYLVFCDSDDYVEKTFVEILLRAVKKENAYIGICGYAEEYEKKTRRHHHMTEGAISKAALYESLLTTDDIGNYAWNKIYKRELFANIRYPKGQKYEDINTTYKLIADSSTIVVVKDILYHYVRRNDSISKTIDIQNFLDYYHATEERNDYIAKEYPFLQEKCTLNMLKFCIVMWNQMAKICGEDSTDIHKTKAEPFHNKLRQVIKGYKKQMKELGLTYRIKGYCILLYPHQYAKGIQFLYKKQSHKRIRA